MGYSDEELNNGLNSSKTDISVWNSGSVYFDDEIVEYQGRYYKALRKTSAELPGRSKTGAWKELDASAFVNDIEDDLYDDDIVPSPAESKTKTLDEPVEVKPAPKVNAKPVNKPILNKKTLKEQQEELKLRKEKLNEQKPVTEEKKAVPVETVTTQSSVERKMMAAPNDQQIVNDILREMGFDKIKGSNTDDNNITSNLVLPKKAKAESTLTWESSHPEVLSITGEVNRPNDGNDIAVNLSLTVSKNKTSSTRFFTVWVKAAEKQYTDGECVDMVVSALNFDHIKGSNIAIGSISYDLELLTHGLYDTEIFWASSKRDIVDETGHLYKDRLIENTKVSLYAVIVKNEEKRLKEFNLILK